MGVVISTFLLAEKILTLLITLYWKCIPEKNLRLKGQLAPTHHPIPVLQQESGHPMPKHEHTTQRWGETAEMGCSQTHFLFFSLLLQPTADENESVMLANDTSAPFVVAHDEFTHVVSG